MSSVEALEVEQLALREEHQSARRRRRRAARPGPGADAAARPWLVAADFCVGRGRACPAAARMTDGAGAAIRWQKQGQASVMVWYPLLRQQLQEYNQQAGAEAGCQTAFAPVRWVTLGRIAGRGAASGRASGLTWVRPALQLRLGRRRARRAAGRHRASGRRP